MPTAQISTVIQPVAPRGLFHNEPFIDFHDPENVHAMHAALTRVGDMLGHEYELVIGGERMRTAEKIESLNPARPAQVVGVHQKAGLEHAERAMEAALEAFASWQYVPVEERAALLLQAAELIRQRKFEFCAWLTYEVGKNWVEADADVAETIDFLEFYAREALRLAGATTPIQLSRGAQSAAVYPDGRLRGDSALEFSLCHYGGHDCGGDRDRQYRGPEAFQRFSDDRGAVSRCARRGGHAARGGELLPRLGRDLRQRDRGAPQDAPDRLHRVKGSGPGYSRPRGADEAGTDLDQAHHSRDGGQGFDHREHGLRS